MSYCSGSVELDFRFEYPFLNWDASFPISNPAFFPNNRLPRRSQIKHIYYITNEISPSISQQATTINQTITNNASVVFSRGGIFPVRSAHQFRFKNL